MLLNGVTSKEEMLKKIEYMNSLGPRLTGNDAHSKFIDYLKKEIADMGIQIYSDPYFFDRWEEKRSELTLHTREGDVELPIASAFPYSGETPESGIDAELVFVRDKRLGYVAANEKIAVIKVGEVDFLPSTIAFNQRASMPDGVTLDENYSGPVATAFVNFPFLKMAKLAGARAVVCIWDGICDELVQGQYLPFILDYQGIPALWVNETVGDRVIEAAKEHLSAKLVLEAKTQKNASSESFYCILPGSDSRECVIVNTHTDGTNCIEENGPIALLSMIKYFKNKSLRRTHIFVFVTGHFRLPSFKNIGGGGVQATSKWLASHRDLWDGKRGHFKAVAGLSVEHLGCTMWRENNGKYVRAGDVEIEMCYTGNDVMDSIYYLAMEGREKVYTLTLRGHNFLHFGEGQPLFNCGIPGIAMVTAPEHLCVISDNAEMDKFDISLMYEQTNSFIRMAELIEQLQSRSIGKCDKYSLVLGKLQ